MLKVWIAGANGQIGRAQNDVLDPMQIETLNTDLDELDITDTDEVINYGSINRPDVIINCTGITDTDECEKNTEHAYRVNALGARNCQEKSPCFHKVPAADVTAHQQYFLKMFL